MIALSGGLVERRCLQVFRVGARLLCCEVDAATAAENAKATTSQLVRAMIRWSGHHAEAL